MTDLFRSAFNYLSSGAGAAGGSSAGGDGRPGSELVGSQVEVGGLKLRIRGLIAEGGYALVFSATDAQGNWYALKRQLAADREASDAIIREIRFLRLLTGHSNIVTYIQAAQLGPQESGHGRAEFLMLTELCSGGSVVEALQKHTFNPEQVLKVFHSACCAIRHMHAQSPPVIHRDMKIENLLFDAKGCVKLCDFGSATTEVYQPDDSWNASQRSQLEDLMSMHTTPMYRAPEMLDMYLNYPIGPPLDVWALGCILYYLCYRSHPFEDSAKLRILNAKYTLPENETPFTAFHPLIESSLRIDPRERPIISDLCERTEALAAAFGVQVTSSVSGLDLPSVPVPVPDPSLQKVPGNRQTPPPAQQQQQPPARPPPPQQSSQAPSRPTHPPATTATTDQQGGASAGAVFGATKGQGLSIFKNLKESSAKVMQTVQSTYGSRGPDFTFVTSRLAVAALADGVPEALAAPAEESVRTIIDTRRGEYAVYNLGQRRLRGDYGGRLSEVALPPIGGPIPPTLNSLFALCKNMALWLRQNSRNFCVIVGPEQHCTTVAVCFLLYCRLVANPLAAMELLTARRTTRVKLPPSVHRLLDLVTSVTTSKSTETQSHAQHEMEMG